MTEEGYSTHTGEDPQQVRDPFLVLTELAAGVLQLIRADARLEVRRARAWLRWKVLAAVRLVVLGVCGVALLSSALSILLSGIASELAVSSGRSEGIARCVVGATTAVAALVFVELSLRVRASSFYKETRRAESTRTESSRQRFAREDERARGQKTAVERGTPQREGERSET